MTLNEAIEHAREQAQREDLWPHESYRTNQIVTSKGA